MSEYTLLVKLDGKSIKVTFPKKPKVCDVAAEVKKQAKIGAEYNVVLSAPDPDFPGESAVLAPEAELKNKQVLSAITEVKAVESWDDVDCPARGKAVLKDNGITPSVGNCLVHMLGYTEPEDLQHVTEALLGKLPLKPLEKARLLKLVESQKGAGGGAARPPSARFSSKTAAASSSATTSSGKAAPGQLTTPTTTASAGTSTPKGTDKDKAASDKSADKSSSTAKKSSSSADKDKDKAADKANKDKKSSKTEKASSSTAAEVAPAQPAAAQAAPVSDLPPADEDEDALLQRILAEGEAEKAAAQAAAQESFATPLQKSELVGTLEGHKDSVLSLAITPDNTTLFTGSGDNTISVWSLKGFFLSQTLTDHSTSVGCLVLDADGMHLFSGSGDGCVIVWDVIAGKATKAFEDRDSHAYGILAMTLANKSPLLFTATGDKKIRGFAVNYKKKTFTLAMEMSGHLESVRSMVVSPDDQELYSASEDATIKVWHACSEAGFKFVSALRGHEGPIYGLAISRDGSTLLSCSADKTITVWRLTNTGGAKGSGLRAHLLPDGPKIQQVLTGHKGDVNCVAINDSATKIFSSGDDKTVKVWGHLAAKSSKKGKDAGPVFALQSTLEGHALIVYPLAVSRDGKLVVSGSADNTAKVWQLLQ